MVYDSVTRLLPHIADLYFYVSIIYQIQVESAVRSISSYYNNRSLPQLLLNGIHSKYILKKLLQRTFLNLTLEV